MNSIALYIILESSTVKYVGFRLVPHTMCVYKDVVTQKKYVYYIPSAIYKCPIRLWLTRGGT